MTKTGTVVDPDFEDCTVAGVAAATLTEDGTYHAEARLLDDLRNAGPTALSIDLRYDGTPPAAADLSRVPAFVGRAPVLTVPVETGGSAVCVLTVSGTAVETRDCSDGTWTPQMLAEDTYGLTVTTRDPAGNTATSTATVALDTTVPGAITVTAPRTPSPATSVTWGLRGDGSPLTCTLTPSVITSPVPCSSGLTADLTGFPDQAYTLTVTATDRAGNTTVATDAHVLDTLAPGMPSVTAPGTVGNALSPTWAFTQPAGTTAECRLDRGLTRGDLGELRRALVHRDGARRRLLRPAGAPDRPGRQHRRPRHEHPVPLRPHRPRRSRPQRPRWRVARAHRHLALDRRDADHRQLPARPRRGAGTPAPAAPASRPYTLPADGSYQLFVTLTDPAGNTSAGAPWRRTSWTGCRRQRRSSPVRSAPRTPPPSRGP